jgi:hypothetical protein
MFKGYTWIVEQGIREKQLHNEKSTITRRTCCRYQDSRSPITDIELFPRDEGMASEQSV